MRYYLSDKAKIVHKWILENNMDIKNSKQAQQTLGREQDDSELKACIITSVLLSENILIDYPGLSSLYLDTNAKIVKDLREANNPQRLYAVMNTKEFQTITSSIKTNDILKDYEYKKEVEKKNNLDMPSTDKQQVNRDKGFDDHVSEREQIAHKYHPNFNEKSKNNMYENYNTKNEYESYNSNLKEDINVYDYGLNHDINGVKTISSRLPDGNFTFEMIIPVGYTGKTQAVNKKILTKKEHDQFINKYKDEIFDLDREKTLERQKTLNREYDYPEDEFEFKR